jgi:hypothetical protein
LVGVPQLLADTIRAVLSGRTDIQLCAVFDGIENLDARLQEIAPEIVILQAGAGAPTREQIQSQSPGVRVLVISEDLRRLAGPNPGEEAEFSPEAIATRVRA